MLCHLCPALVPSLRRPDHPSYGSWSSRDLQDLGPYHDIIPSNALVHLVVLHCYDVCLGVCAACCPAYVRCAMHVCACPATPCSSSRPRTDVDQYHHLVDPDPRGLVISWYWLSSPPALPLSTHCVCSCVALCVWWLCTAAHCLCCCMTAHTITSWIRTMAFRVSGIPSLVISWYWLSSPPAPSLSTHCVCSCVACVCGVSALLRTAMARGAMLASTVRLGLTHDPIGSSHDLDLSIAMDWILPNSPCQCIASLCCC